MFDAIFTPRELLAELGDRAWLQAMLDSERALARWHATGSRSLLDAYSATCLRRVWRAEHFSWWMTSMLHRFPERDRFGERLQLSQLDYTCRSTAAATSLAENYVGLPVDFPAISQEPLGRR